MRRLAASSKLGSPHRVEVLPVKPAGENWTSTARCVEQAAETKAFRDEVPRRAEESAVAFARGGGREWSCRRRGVGYASGAAGPAYGGVGIRFNDVDIGKGPRDERAQRTTEIGSNRGPRL